MRRTGETRHCVICGTAFYVKAHLIREGRGQFCSHPCSVKGRKSRRRGQNRVVYRESHAVLITQVGDEILVDKEDLPLLLGYTWGLLRTRAGNYAITKLMKSEGGGSLLLHRLLLDPPPGFQVDHVNMNPLDCRRSNLRLATYTQNVQNRNVRKDSVSGYKGVSRPGGNKRWIAVIVVSRQRIPLGLFDTKEEAARAYDKAARQYFGPFARLNFPDPD